MIGKWNTHKKWIPFFFKVISQKAMVFLLQKNSALLMKCWFHLFEEWWPHLEEEGGSPKGCGLSRSKNLPLPRSDFPDVKSGYDAKVFEPPSVPPAETGRAPYIANIFFTRLKISMMIYIAYWRNYFYKVPVLPHTLGCDIYINFLSLCNSFFVI